MTHSIKNYMKRTCVSQTFKFVLNKKTKDEASEFGIEVPNCSQPVVHYINYVRFGQHCQWYEAHMEAIIWESCY